MKRFNVGMLVTFIIRLMFVVWALAVAVLSIISHPGSKDLLMSVKLTSSGFVMHCIAYFVGMLLCCWAFDRKEDRCRRSEVRGQRTGKDRGRRSENGSRRAKGQMSEVTFIWISGLLIFLFSVVLEVVQFYLPYRTFNVYDLVANGVGVLLFVIVRIRPLKELLTG